MNPEPGKIASIRHESQIFSIALSRDESLLACGGTDSVPVTVWRLADATCVARLQGLKRQAHALAFSPDGSRLAAANLWGAQCVWRLEDGALIGEKAGGSTRQTRSLVFPKTSGKERLLMISGSLVGGKPDRLLAPDGLRIADSYRGLRVLRYRSTRVLAELDRERLDFTNSPMRARSWSGDSNVLALSGDGFVATWQPFTSDAPIRFARLSSTDGGESIAALSHPARLLYATDHSVQVLELPEQSAARARTRFEDFVSSVPEPPEPPRFEARRDWKWGFTQWRHEAVHTHEDSQLVWYSVSSGRDDGAGVQAFESFLRDGPQGGSPPEPILVEIVQAVRILTREKR